VLLIVLSAKVMPDFMYDNSLLVTAFTKAKEFLQEVPNQARPCGSGVVIFTFSKFLAVLWIKMICDTRLERSSIHALIPREELMMTMPPHASYQNTLGHPSH
jgi:hypothetical protein